MTAQRTSIKELTTMVTRRYTPDTNRDDTSRELAGILYQLPAPDWAIGSSYEDIVPYEIGTQILRIYRRRHNLT